MPADAQNTSLLFMTQYFRCSLCSAATAKQNKLFEYSHTFQSDWEFWGLLFVWNKAIFPFSFFFGFVFFTSNHDISANMLWISTNNLFSPSPLTDLIYIHPSRRNSISGYPILILTHGCCPCINVPSDWKPNNIIHIWRPRSAFNPSSVWHLLNLSLSGLSSLILSIPSRSQIPLGRPSF